MGSEKAAVTESWLGGLWRRNKVAEAEKEVTGILSFELASVLSKVVKVWHCLSDLEILRLKFEIIRSAGVRNLVSTDENRLMNVVLDEILDNVVYVGRAAIRLGKRCSDPTYHQIERLFVDPLRNCADWSGWVYKWKKMDRRVKKMERFIGAMIQLTEDQEALAECEQTLRRLKANSESDHVKLSEFQQKVMWRRQVVQNLRELSPWYRSYDYMVRLLIRSISTILEKVTYTFGGSQESSADGSDDYYTCFSKALSLQGLMRSLVYPSKCNLEDWCAGPLPERNGPSKRQSSGYHHFLYVTERNLHSLHLSQVAPFKGCLQVATDSPVVSSYRSGGGNLVDGNDTGIRSNNEMWVFSPSNKILWRLASLYLKFSSLAPPPGTLGHAALAVHYANLIVRIEKLAYSPNSFRLDSKDDLYDMLPFTIRSALRTRLRPLTKAKSFVVDAAWAEKQRSDLVHMLQWISPLAHNTGKWHSELSFEKHLPGCADNVLLVQTLYFADQAKTEAAIVQLLVSMSLLCRAQGESKKKAVPDEA